MQLYVVQYKGAFPGGGWTSAAHLFRPVTPAFGPNNCPDVIQTSDWLSPIAKMMGIKFDEGKFNTSRISRYTTLNAFGTFRCPENDFLAGPFGVAPPPPNTPAGSFWPVLTMNSYVTSMVFHLRANTPSNALPNGGTAITVSETFWQVPDGYTPKITKVGNPSRKIFIADGARYSRPDTPPDYDTNPFGSNGGAFSDQGAFAAFSNAWARGKAPGQTGSYTTGPSDSRLYGFRHGSRKPFLPGDNYRLNVGFFDGHVETMGDLEVSNPSFWVPKGTDLSTSSTQFFPDVRARFNLPYGGRMTIED